jgi:PAS domain S-box-containing protein
MRLERIDRLLWRYSLVVLAPAIALLLRWGLVGSTGEDLPHYITFFPAVMLVAIFAGLGPGLLATALSGLTMMYWILPPEGFDVESRADTIGLGIFVLMGVMMSTVADLYHRARRRAADREKDLAVRESEERSRRVGEELLRRYELLSAHTRDIILFIDRDDGRILEANAAATQAYGYTRKELLALTILDLRAAHLQGLTADQLAEADACGILFQAVHRRKDGSIFPVEVSARGATIDARHMVVSVVRDVTERKRVEDAVLAAMRSAEAARVEAEAANRSKDEFLATLSHELRTPLNAILGWLYLLKSEGTKPENLREALEMIEQSTRAQAQLVEDILDVSRIIMGKVRIELKEVDLTSVIEAAVEAIRPAAEAKGIRLLKVLDSKASPIHGDPARLQQIVWNLISNAVKFTPKGGDVHVLLERADSSAKITVRDTGIGITPDFLPHVFERFRQADASASRRHGGLGLGLAIVRHLTELHGGTVGVESEGEGKGATFTARFPLAAVRIPPPKQPDEEAARVQAQERQPPPSLRGVKVLVVDDEENACLVIRRILEKAEAQVETARSSAEGLEKLRQSRPDILVSDIGMPGEDGYSFLMKVRGLESEKGRKIPAIALTAYAGPNDRRQAFNAGYQMHLPKPADPDELVVAVAMLSAWPNG